MHRMESFKKMWDVCKIMNQMDEVPFFRSLACWAPCTKHASDFFFSIVGMLGSLYETLERILREG